MKRKLTLSIVLICIFAIIMQPMVYASGVGDAALGLWEDIIGDTTIDTDVEIGKTDQIRYNIKATERLFGIVQLIGSIISVIALAIIGIRYMVSSVEEQAKMKGVIGYYITGAVLVFATSNILSIAYNIIRSLE